MKSSVKTEIGIVLIAITAAGFALPASQRQSGRNEPDEPLAMQEESSEQANASSESSAPKKTPSHPMAIESLRNGEYPGGQFAIEETLSDGSNFERHIASYQSEGLKIFGLLTVPKTEKPEGGYPAVLFMHGHIPPKQYSTLNSYPTYPLNLSRNGFVMFKPDLRGHGESEGDPSSAHYSHEYVIDTLNALAYLKNHPDVNPQRIGYWGHSNGGEIGLRTVLADPDVKAASFWAGVVGSYESMFETHVDIIPFLRQENPLTEVHGLPSENPEFWNTIEPYEHLNDIRIPIEIQHGTKDRSVPVVLSQELKAALEAAGKDVEYTEYPGDNHDIAANAAGAWRKSIDFFKRHL